MIRNRRAMYIALIGYITTGILALPPLGLPRIISIVVGVFTVWFIIIIVLKAKTSTPSTDG